jgi:nucleoside-diphosphate-sugar epimerase
MRVLVTGGAGRLGINVCKFLMRAGYKVRILDLKTPRNQRSIRELGNTLEICWGDITWSESVRSALAQVDAVVHMAGILPPVADEVPELSKRVNVDGTRTLIEAIKEEQRSIPLIYTSSVTVFGPSPDALEPLCTDRNQPCPIGAYADTKYLAENLIRQSGLDFVILRLTATMYLAFEVSDVRRMFSIPVNNRVEFCHPDDAALAIANAVKNFAAVNGMTLIISGGSGQRMLYRDMVGRMLGVMGLPLPPEKKFTKEPYCLDWYDTTESERLLRFQCHTFADYVKDYTRELSKRYTRLFLPFMRWFVSPLLGKLVTQLMR